MTVVKTVAATLKFSTTIITLSLIATMYSTNGVWHHFSDNMMKVVESVACNTTNFHNHYHTIPYCHNAFYSWFSASFF